MRSRHLFYCIGLITLFAAPNGSAQTVTMKDDVFQPKNKSIQVGQSVTWINSGSKKHTATSDVTTGPDAFDTGDISPGGQKSQTFNSPGIYFYHCTHHGSAGNGTTIGTGMAGSITVTAVPVTGGSPCCAPPCCCQPAPCSNCYQRCCHKKKLSKFTLLSALRFTSSSWPTTIFN
jgi:plastocyanin